MIKKNLILSASALVGFGVCSIASAALLPVYSSVIDKNSPACLNAGDAVTCSAPLLNYVSGFAVTKKVADGGYVLPTPQGALASYIVLQAGGGATPNGDANPAPHVVEDGFKSNDGGSNDFRATGKADGTDVPLGNMNNPDNNDLVAQLGASADVPGTWDVGIDWLIKALSPDVRRELMIGFDYNQPQNATTSLNYWALITVRDLQKNLPDKNYEIAFSNNQPYNVFSSTKDFASKPSSTDFGTVYGVTCVDTNGSESTPILPIPGGNCPSGYEVKIDNAQSTADTEFFSFLPELNANLETYLGQGYDVVSVRMLFGCFGGTPRGSFNPGQGYLADENSGGKTTHCESGGFGDVYLLAGAPQEKIPEPGSIALIAAGLGLTFAVGRIRRKTLA